MNNQKLSWQESSKKINTFFLPSKNEGRPQLLETFNQDQENNFGAKMLEIKAIMQVKLSADLHENKLCKVQLYMP